jgi:hypothetical protein
MPTKMRARRPARKHPTAPPAIEQQYQEMVQRMWRPVVVLQTDYGDSLEQPSPLRVVRSVTTYSAYEDPV